MRLRVAFLFIVPAMALGAACSTTERSLDLGRSRQAIVGGSTDTTHGAVVALTMTAATSFGRCSRTIVHIAGGVGMVLTAAHCFEASPTKVTVAFRWT